MQIEFEHRPNLLLLRLRGDMRLWNHPDLERSLLELFYAHLLPPPPQFVLALCGVTHVDTLAIGTLARIVTACSTRGIPLSIAMPRGVAGRALQSVRIFEAWPNFSEEATALQAAGARA